MAIIDYTDESQNDYDVTVPNDCDYTADELAITD